MEDLNRESLTRHQRSLVLIAVSCEPTMFTFRFVCIFIDFLLVIFVDVEIVFEGIQGKFESEENNSVEEENE